MTTESEGSPREEASKPVAAAPSRSTRRRGEQRTISGHDASFTTVHDMLATKRSTALRAAIAVAATQHSRTDVDPDPSTPTSTSAPTALAPSPPAQSRGVDLAGAGLDAQPDTPVTATVTSAPDTPSTHHILSLGDTPTSPPPWARFTDSQLRACIGEINNELSERALARADLDALIAHGYAHGFHSTGKARDPYIHGWLLICPGSLIARSATNHECVFVHVGPGWVWENDSVAKDDITISEQHGKRRQRSVTLLAAEENLEYDVITSRAGVNGHRMTHVASYQIRNGQPVLVGSRDPKLSADNQDR